MLKVSNSFFKNKKLGLIFEELSPKKIFLVGNGAERFQPVKKIMEESGIPYVGFNDFSPNPIYEDVKKGVMAFIGSGCDTIMAFGIIYY